MQERNQCHCFELTEQVTAGIHISRKGVPALDNPIGRTPPIHLHPKLEELFTRAPGGYDRLLHTELEIHPQVVLLRPLRRSDILGETQALVRVQTRPGDGGTLQLTDCAYTQDVNGGRVRTIQCPFPSVGVSPFCTDEDLDALREGVEEIDLFVVMRSGSAFQIHRGGQLEGAPWKLVVRWDGHTLIVRTYPFRAGGFRPRDASPTEETVLS